MFYFGWILDVIAFFKDTNIYKQKSTWTLSWITAIIVGLISLKLFKPIDRFFFVFLNFFWVIIMFFVELKIFQMLE